MTVALKTGAFVGTDETTGVSIANNVTTTGSEIDMFGNVTSEGWAFVYLKYTAPASTVGTIDISIFPSRVTGQSYQDQVPLFNSIVPVASTTQKIPIGQIQCSRYMTGAVKNNATTQTLTNVALLYELYQES